MVALVLACTDKGGTSGGNYSGLSGGFDNYSATGSDPAFLQTGKWCKSSNGLNVRSNTQLTSWKDKGSEGTSTVLGGALHKSGELTGYTDEVSAGGSGTFYLPGSGTSTAFGDVACGADVDEDGTIEPTETCEGTWKVMIELEQNGSCNDPQNTELSLYGVTLEALRADDGDTTCSAGSGRFALLPSYVGDLDDDDYEHGVYYAVQDTGTGTMTSMAWVTEIEVVDDDGLDLRVVHADELIGFDSSDVVVGRTSISTALTGTHNFSTGVITGHPAFVVEDIPAAQVPEIVVDMTWSCSSSGGINYQVAQGYVLDLDEIGCDVEQKLVMRPETNFLRWQVYGDPTHDVKTFTNTVPAGRTFSASHLGVAVTGVLTATTETYATLQLDTIKVGGVDVCTPDTYTLPAL